MLHFAPINSALGWHLAVAEKLSDKAEAFVANLLCFILTAYELAEANRANEERRGSIGLLSDDSFHSAGTAETILPVHGSSRMSLFAETPERYDASHGQPKVAKVMGEFKHGQLFSGSDHPVADRDQAIAIAMKEAGLSKQQAAPNQQPDATARFAAKLADRSQWKVVPSVPVFDEHTEQRWEPEKDANGQPVMDPATGKPKMRKNVEQFGLAELQQHADQCNRMAAQGKPVGLTLGHTKDDGPESEQPETIGFGVNYRVAYSAQLGRHVILHDELFDPGKYETAKSFPYRSVERWKAGKYFAPIALLRREPARNLGVVAYQKGNDWVIRYSMEAYAMDPASMSPAAPAAPQGAPAAAPDPAAEKEKQDRNLFAKYAASHPVLGHFIQNHQKYAALIDSGTGQGVPEGQVANPPHAAPGGPAQMMAGSPAAMWAQVDDAGREGGGRSKTSGNYERRAMEGNWHEKMAAAPGGGMGAPSGTNTMIPNIQPQQHQAATNGEVERYAALEERIRDMEAELADSRQGERLARYAATLNYMRDVEGYPVDVASELTDLQDASQEQFDKAIEKIKRYAAPNRAATGPHIRLAESPRQGADSPLTEDEMYEVLKYQADPNNKLTTQEVIAKVRQGVVRGA